MPTPRDLAGALLLTVVWLATPNSPAHADLYRCVGPNGDIVFTDDRAACPGAAKHESTGAVQNLPTSDPATNTTAPPARRRATSALDERAALKRRWQAKKRDTEAELRKLEADEIYLRRFVTGCNRGADIVTQDEIGLERAVSCSEIRREYEQVRAKQAPLRAYLAEGLRRECRQSGCLPGWIR